MKTIQISTLLGQGDGYRDIKRVLDGGGLVCVPCNTTYRIVADLNNEDAVKRLMQSKRRTHKAPSLVFVSDISMLEKVAADIDPVAKELAEVWPAPLTILFKANPDLPRKVVKLVSKANGKIGVRVPEHEVARRVLDDFGGPLLVSSANREDKKGAHSAAQVRKNFLGRIDLFINAGDLPQEASSTVVDVKGGKVKVTRPGAFPVEKLEKYGA